MLNSTCTNTAKPRSFRSGQVWLPRGENRPTSSNCQFCRNSSQSPPSIVSWLHTISLHFNFVRPSLLSVGLFCRHYAATARVVPRCAKTRCRNGQHEPTGDGLPTTAAQGAAGCRAAPGQRRVGCRRALLRSRVLVCVLVSVVRCGLVVARGVTDLCRMSGSR